MARPVSSFHRFANPGRFMRLAGRLMPWFAAVTVVLMGAGLYFALFDSPPDYQQGDSVRIMYVHVPSAWMALFVYVSIAAASAAALIWRHPLADLFAKAASPLGAGFTALALLTGILWGKPAWGDWWVWDARLTSVLVLFFLYLGHIGLMYAFDDAARGAKAAAILALVGVINVPIIKFSVDWWNSLHQPASVIRLSGPTIHPTMLLPLLLLAVGFTFYFLTLVLVRMKSEIVAARIRAMRLAQLGA